jgi:hypothetical protein
MIISNKKCFTATKSFIRTRTFSKGPLGKKKETTTTLWRRKDECIFYAQIVDTYVDEKLPLFFLTSIQLQYIYAQQQNVILPVVFYWFYV